MLTSDILQRLTEYIKRNRTRSVPIMYSKRKKASAPACGAKPEANFCECDICFEQQTDSCECDTLSIDEKDTAPAFLPTVGSFCESNAAPASASFLDDMTEYVSSRQLPAFSTELMRLIDESGHKDSVIYTRAGIDRRHFSKIRSNPDYHPSKQTAAAFCIALRLNKDRSDRLLSSAGYTFSSSEIFDLVIQFCIENGIYDLSDVNTALVYFSQKPIGAAE